MDKYSLGVRGEMQAKEYLISIGYNIIDMNVNFPKIGELDIVAEDNGVLVFVEVRTRADATYGEPFETITKTKIKKIVAASRRYLYMHKKFYKGYRYDAIGILNGNLTHIKNAFDAH